MQEISKAFQSRLDALRREWERRVYSLERLNPRHVGLSRPEAPAASRGAAVLLAGAPGTDYSAVRHALERDSASITGAFSPATAADFLGRSSFDAVIVVAGNGGDDYRPLLAAMKMHPELSALPVLVLAPEAAGAAMISGLARLNPSVACIPAARGALQRWVRDALAHKELGQALSTAFIAARSGTAGCVPGVFSNGFARIHLETLLASPHATLTSLAQVELSFSLFGNESLWPDSRAAAVRKLASLMPASVMISESPDHGFWLLFPETGQAMANHLLDLACQSLRTRPLAVTDDAAPVEMRPRFRTLTARPGDNVLTVAQRCRNFRPDRPARVLH